MNKKIGSLGVSACSTTKHCKCFVVFRLEHKTNIVVPKLFELNTKHIVIHSICELRRENHVIRIISKFRTKKQCNSQISEFRTKTYCNS